MLFFSPFFHIYQILLIGGYIVYEVLGSSGSPRTVDLDSQRRVDLCPISLCPRAWRWTPCFSQLLAEDIPQTPGYTQKGISYSDSGMSQGVERLLRG